MGRDHKNEINGSVLRAFGEIETGFVQEAAERKKAFPRRILILAAAAAVLVLLIGGALLVIRPWSSGEHTAQARPTTAPEETASPAPDATASPAPGETAGPVNVPGGQTGGKQTHNAGTLGTGYSSYVVYNKQFYDLMEDVDDPSLIGEKVGEVTKLVDGSYYLDSLSHIRVTTGIFAEHTGGMYGDIYSVRGYSTDFMLCQKKKNGDVRIYFNYLVCRSEYGRDFLEDGLHLSESFASLQLLRESRWNTVEHTGTDFYEEIDPALYGDRIEAFLAALLGARVRREGEVNPYTEVPTGGYILESEGTLRVVLKDGLYFDVLLTKTGYAFLNRNLLGTKRYVLCLEHEAADGIGELIRGKYVETQIPAPATIEDAAADPWLGAAVPKRVPEGMEVQAVVLEKHSLAELRGDFLPERGEDDPTKWISIQLGTANLYPDVHIDAVPREDEGYLNEYGGVLSEFAELDGFSVSDLVYLRSDPDQHTVAAFVHVGEASVRITVTVPADGERGAEELIFALLGSI